VSCCPHSRGPSSARDDDALRCADDTSRLEQLLADGCNVVVTDFPRKPTLFPSTYIAQLPNSASLRCNPVNAPPGCRDVIAAAVPATGYRSPPPLSKAAAFTPPVAPMAAQSGATGVCLRSSAIAAAAFAAAFAAWALQ